MCITEKVVLIIRCLLEVYSIFGPLSVIRRWFNNASGAQRRVGFCAPTQRICISKKKRKKRFLLRKLLHQDGFCLFHSKLMQTPVLWRGFCLVGCYLRVQWLVSWGPTKLHQQVSLSFIHRRFHILRSSHMIYSSRRTESTYAIAGVVCYKPFQQQRYETKTL